MFVDGKALFIDAQTPASVETNAAGMLTTQQTNTLGVVALQVEVAGAALDSKPFALRQFAGVRDDLKTLKTEQLKTARDKNNVLLLPQAIINNQTEVDGIRQAINQCMALEPQHPLDATGCPGRPASWGSAGAPAT